MNVAISTTSVSSGKAASTASTSAAGSAQEGGFASALIQAIDGGGNTAAVTAGLSLPVGLVGLLGQLGGSATEDPNQDLLAMLANLVEQLQQLEQGDVLPKEAEDQLAALLAAFQGVIQQLGQSQPTDATGQSTVELPIQTAQQADVPTSKPVVKALRETLQQLSTAIASGKDGARLASDFAGQLKSLLDSLAPLTPNAAATATQTATNSVNAPSSDTKAATASENGAAVPKEAMNQAAVVVQETRRPVQMLREPLWRVNVVNATESASSDGQTAVVPSVIASEEASNSDSQPAWTFLQSDPLANVDTAAGKTALPAQLPTQVPVQQFAEQMEKFLVKQFLLTQGNGTSEAKLSLTPEHLGQVDIRLIMHNGQLTAQFMTDNGMARDLLENQMSQLKAALNGQGLHVERLEVIQQPASSSNTSFMHQEHRQSNSGNGNGSNGRNKGGLYEDPAVFAAELERTSFLREFGYGSELNVTA
ncbi:flagellar hook-length control protein FliK [Cohnella silvisoli]|uniref:Flagellar hook-length control protein FliK n=1 Tax=Cohnella silvisoli TaxID=2873699 RepID=A0ABV1KVY4_9BACL|nr:flagellar hook-length control protein FliK [Cohnella silvisoli]MCD9023364.1 flagellar hook-length control protein FliK [Cohnella silvisoli]